MRCRFDEHGEAIVVVRLSKGCVAYRDDIDAEQALCLQHLSSLPDGALGEYEVVEWLTADRREPQWTA